MNFKNFEKTDRRIIGTALVLFFFSILLNWQDAWIYHLVQGKRGDMQEIGSVKSLNNDVRRRHEIALSWLPLRNKNEVYQGDSVFTGNNSTVVIATKTGEEISIAPNSLVVINARKDSISLDIGFGSVEGRIEKGRTFLISSNNNITELAGDNAKIKIDAGEGNKIVLNVLAGEVRMRTADGDKVLKQSDITEMSSDGRVIDPNRNNINILTPLAEQRIKPQKEIPIEFNWASRRKLDRTKIKIAKDPSMNDLVADARVEGDSFLAYDLPADIPLFWQVIAEGAQSPVTKFYVVGDRPPVPIYPKPGFQLYYDPNGPEALSGTSLELSWAEGSPTSQFEVQMAADLEFKKILIEQKSRSPKIIANNLLAGEYFWRVRSIDFPEQKWSETSYFRVGPEPSKILTPPLPRLAVETFYIETKLHGRAANEIHRLTKMGAQRHIAKFPTIRWSRAAGADRYELQIARNIAFTDIIISQTLQSTSFTWKNIAPGQYYWRVRGLAENAKAGLYTSSQTLVIALAPPIPTSQSSIIDEVPDPVLLSAPPPPLTIAWNPTVFSGFYELQFAKEASFTQPLNYIQSQSNKTFQLESSGLYYWRVRSLDPNRNPISQFTQTNTLEFQRVYKDPALNRNLAAVYPGQKDSIIIVGKNNTDLEFRWSNPFPGLNYRVEISHDPGFDDVFHSHVTKNNFFNFSGVFNKRVVYWRIRAESPKFTSDWTAANRFVVTYESTPFDFEKSQEMFTARLRARERQQEILAAQSRRLQQLRTPASTVDLQLDTPQLIDPANEYTLETNLPTNTTSAALNAQPFEKFYTQVKSQPTFRWERVPAAERYVFEISRDPDFKTSLVKAPAWDPYFEWDTARPGQFYYRVQAFNERYTRSAYSPTQPLLVTVNTPTAISSDFYVEVFDEPKDMWQPPSPFQLSWTPTVFARGYEIEFSEDKSFALTKVFRTPETAQELRVSKPGLYYWRVRPVNEFGVALSTFSSIRSIEVVQTRRGPASVNALTGLFPIDRTMLFVGEGLMNLVFHWTTPELSAIRKLASNEKFQLEISDNKDFRRVIARSSSSRPELMLKNDLPEGELFWRVRYANTTSPIYQFSLRRERKGFKGGP